MVLINREIGIRIGDLRRRDPGLPAAAARRRRDRPSARARYRTSTRSTAMRSAPMRDSASSPSQSGSTTASPATVRSIAASSPTSPSPRCSIPTTSARARARAPCPGTASTRRAIRRSQRNFPWSRSSRASIERIAHNPDFVALQGDVDALAQRAAQPARTFAEPRQPCAERDAVDADRLKRECTARGARAHALRRRHRAG